MKTKFLLPVLAMFFAIGVSFATATGANDPTTDYILQNGNFEPIQMELNCGQGNQVCQVQFERNGPIYDVYNAETSSSLKTGNGDVIRLWQ